MSNMPYCFVPDCSGVVTTCAFMTVNYLLIKHFEMSVYYYYYYMNTNTHSEET